MINTIPVTGNKTHLAKAILLALLTALLTLTISFYLITTQPNVIWSTFISQTYQFSLRYPKLLQIHESSTILPFGHKSSVVRFTNKEGSVEFGSLITIENSPISPETIIHSLENNDKSIIHERNDYTTNGITGTLIKYEIPSDSYLGYKFIFSHNTTFYQIYVDSWNPYHLKIYKSILSTLKL